jgi:pimeloyl-ACP methyl ester carboxylesterase
LLIESLVQMPGEPDVRLFVAQTEGPADRVLLVIHGGPDWDHTYLRVPLLWLDGSHRVVFTDLRGCGRSTTGLAADRYTPDAVVTDLLGLLDVLGVERADVLGFSYGGMIAQRLAVAAPERIRRLIIASSSIPPVPADAYADWPEAAALRDTNAFAWADDPSPESVRADAVGSVPVNVWRERSQAELLRRLEQVRFSAEWARPFLSGALPPARPQQSQARLAASGIPILLLHGRQDLTFPAKLAEQVAAEVATATAVLIDQAGHMAHIDQPEAWIAAVSSFLAEE